SRIAVERDGKPLAVGAVEFDARKIYMSARLLASEGDGLYVVKYRACVAGTTCSDGQFGFRVDAASAKNYVDLTQQNEVTVHLKNVKYMPAEFIIRPGTRVVWVNDDPAPHFVNSDPHPSHNAFPQLNSLEIPLHGTYEFVFTEPGEYAFHCSAHVPQNMFGRIIVRADATQINATPTTVSLAPTLPAYGTVATPFLTAAPTLTPTIVPTAQPTRINPTEPTTTASPQKVSEAELPPQRFAAHFVSAAPEHAALLDAPPQKIELHFNFTLARNSSIVVRKDGEKLALGDLEFEANQLETANLR
ncbi:MAG: cupredoxin domain-containing protein, partial [Chloroflexi bacterium]|nr:cupredoxin domain-containing protein [Chloroflexota bacterium]